MSLIHRIHHNFDPELTQALREREMQVEHTINYIRLSGVTLLFMLNFIGLLQFGHMTPRIIGVFIIIVALFLAYSFFVKHFSQKGKYSPWLKYLTVTVDFIVLAASFQKFRSAALIEMVSGVSGLTDAPVRFFQEMSADVVSTYLLIFVLYNFLSSLRNGYLIILYSSLLAVGSSAVIMLQSDMVVFAQAYTLFLVAMSGILILTVSISFNKLFLRFQAAADKVKEYSQTLEVKVEERTQKLKRTNENLNEALMAVEQSNKKILDSIHYAKRIQNSLLPADHQISEILPLNLIIWLPRDIVGGDIYFVEQFKEGSIVAVVDCTGHGIPGAFMTMLAVSGIKRITTDEACLDPAEILKRLNKNLKTILHQDTDLALSDDGLDASICFIDKQKQNLTFSGARHSLVCIRQGQMQRIKGDRQSVGYKKSDSNQPYTNHQVSIDPGMSFFLYTDGLIDQLGGPRNFSFGRDRFLNLLTASLNGGFGDLQDKIIQSFDAYRGDNEIQDDITILGFRLDTGTN